MYGEIASSSRNSADETDVFIPSLKEKGAHSALLQYETEKITAMKIRKTSQLTTNQQKQELENSVRNESVEQFDKKNLDHSNIDLNELDVAQLDISKLQTTSALDYAEHNGPGTTNMFADSKVYGGTADSLRITMQKSTPYGRAQSDYNIPVKEAFHTVEVRERASMFARGNKLSAGRKTSIGQTLQGTLDHNLRVGQKQ